MRRLAPIPRRNRVADASTIAASVPSPARPITRPGYAGRQSRYNRAAALFEALIRGRNAARRIDDLADTVECVPRQLNRNAWEIGYRDRVRRARKRVSHNSQAVRREIEALGAIRNDLVVLCAGALNQRIAANNAYPAIGDLDVKAGIADSAAGCRRRPFAGINPAANYSSLGCAALHIMPDQLAAKEAAGDGEARRLIDLHACVKQQMLGLPLFLNAELEIVRVSVLSSPCRMPT